MFVRSMMVFLSALFALAQDPNSRHDGEEEKIAARRAWFASQRGLDKVQDADKRFRAAQAAQQDYLSRDMRGDEPTWQAMGPTPMVMLDWAMGKVAGRVSAMEYDPTNQDIMYLATASGGVWKTLDGGESWFSIFDEYGTQTIGALHVEADNPQNVWVGTGEHGNSCVGYFGLGLFKSTDGGATFSPRNGSGANTLEASHITSVLVHPVDGSILVGGESWCPDGNWTNSGLFRSTDDGNSWTKIISGPINDIIIDPTDADILYTSVGANFSTININPNDFGVYKSTDGGVTWNRLDNGIPTGATARRTRLALAQSSPNVIYALMNQGSVVLYRSDDGGASWNTQNTNACEGQCSYNLCLDVDPTDPDSVLVGTIRPALSTNAGVTLNILTNSWSSGQQVHQDTHVVKFDKGTTTRGADGNRFWVGSDGGIWRTDDRGASWNELNNDLNITQFYDIAVDPDNSAYIYGGAQDNSSSYTLGPMVWDVSIVTGDGFMNLVDPAEPNVIFQTSYASGGFPYIVRSDNYAQNGWTFVSTSGMTPGDPWPWVIQLAIADKDDSTPTSMFAGSSRIYRTNTSGVTPWEDISGVLGSNARVSIIAVQAIDGKLPMYVGKEDGTIFRCDDASLPVGSTVWTDVTNNFPTFFVSGLAMDPSDPMRVWVTRSGFGGSKIYRSDNGGGTWTAVGAGLPDLPANEVRIDPRIPTRVFIAMDNGVYQSFDSGDNFVPMMNGMPQGNVVTDIEVDDDPYVLTAGSYGRGAWQISLQTQALSVVPGEDQAGCSGSAMQVSMSPSGGVQPFDYSWSVTSGPNTSAGQFSDTAIAAPTFTPTAPGTYELSCMVSDTLGNQLAGTLTVTALDGGEVFTTLMTNWSLGQGDSGYSLGMDRNGNGVFELLDLLIESTSPLCD